jgi:mannose-6-phosphate isomerase
MPDDCGLRPLFFEPIFKEKVWGGQALKHKLAKNIPSGKSIGESWELSAVPGDESVCRSGIYEGKSLPYIFEREGERLAGRRRVPAFPLLYKFIDSNQKLSIQVHPADCASQTGETPVAGKTECWFVVDARPGAHIICGLRENVTVHDVEKAAEVNRVPELCNRVPVRSGDVIFVPAGTVHALLEGVMIYEVQQTSDTTYRLYDWGRTDASRPLHLRQALRALDAASHDRHVISPVALSEEKGFFHAIRVVSRYFALEEYRTEALPAISLGAKNSFQVVTVLDGEIMYAGEGGGSRLTKGQTLLVPASAAPLEMSAAVPAHFLVSYVPDIREHIIGPLLEKGVSREAIIGLGGNPFRNDVAAYMDNKDI